MTRMAHVINRTSVLRLMIALAILALAVNALRRLVPVAFAQAPHAVVPYTAVLVETITDAQGKAHPGTLMTEAQRSDGSKSMHLGIAQRERIIHLYSGEIITTNDPKKRMSTEFSSVPYSTFIQSPASNCTKNLDGGTWTSQPITVSGEKTISGYRAVAISRGDLTQWFALDCGCALIGYTSGKSEFKLVSLTRGEPNPSEFSVGSDYTEGPPSSLVADEPPSASCNDTCKANLSKMWQSRDDHYFKNRAAHPK